MIVVYLCQILLNFDYFSSIFDKKLTILMMDHEAKLNLQQYCGKYARLLL